LSGNLTPSRYPSRASRDTTAINAVLDAGLFCTVAFVRDGLPHQIPTGYCRVGDEIFVHGSIKSHFMDSILGSKVSFSVTLMDGLVLSDTAFDHSFNYRSVIGFSEAREVTDFDEKMKVFCEFTDRYIPGRIADIGRPTEDQVAITRIARLTLDECAVKTREGDTGLTKQTGKWVGVIPVSQQYGEPEPDQINNGLVSLPDYISELLRNHA
jgi:nitroimidazol reductase NimA-like FMN-containing flavoprotein (pyridoxamine 5'-phosphate oxidase superfamily)